MKKIFRHKFLWLLFLILAAGGYSACALSQPLPQLKAADKSVDIAFNQPAPRLAWPATGQSAAGIAGSSYIYTSGQQTPVPTASTAKLITALTVLKSKPLKLGESGPTITLGPADVSYYEKYVAEEGSVVGVGDGEQISEYQVLETMLLPSANNMADSLATWAFGSLPAYKAAAARYIKSIGLDQTTIGSDASGFLPDTTSTARDLVKLGEAAMQNPVIAQIVSQSMASGIPIAGTIHNYNSLLGTSGIVGVKTGNNNQDPGVFIGAARTTVGAKPVTIVTAYMNAPSLFESMKNSLPLIRSMQANFENVTVIKAGSILANYRDTAGNNLPVVVSQPVSLVTWSGGTLNARAPLPVLPSTAKAGDLVSTLTVSDPFSGNKKSVPLKLAGTPAAPSLWYRLTHP